jgi:hypothetical protein
VQQLWAAVAAWKRTQVSTGEKEYYIALGTWTHVCEEVSALLNNGYELAGNLVILSHEDEQGKYVAYYQPMIGTRSKTEGRGR